MIDSIVVTHGGVTVLALRSAWTSKSLGLAVREGNLISYKTRNVLDEVGHVAEFVGRRA